MPTFEYICPRRHLTTKLVRKGEPPKTTKCLMHMSTTHFPNCADFHICGLRAKRTITFPHTVLHGEGFTGAGKDMHTR